MGNRVYWKLHEEHFETYFFVVVFENFRFGFQKERERKKETYTFVKNLTFKPKDKSKSKIIIIIILKRKAIRWKLVFETVELLVQTAWWTSVS